MTHKKIPTYLTDEQRQMMMEIPTDLSDRDLARYYTLTSEELELVNRRRRPANRFGFAVQLALLHFPGRPLAEYRNQKQVPRPILMGCVLKRWSRQLMHREMLATLDSEVVRIGLPQPSPS